MVNGLSDLVYFLQQYEIIEVVLPFLLVFTIIFAILQKIKLFGDEKKSINIVVALIMGILTVAPHLSHNYPSQYDPVVIINTLLPSVSVLSIAVIMLLFLWGMFTGREKTGNTMFEGIIILGMVLILGYIFGATVGWWNSPSDLFGGWWGSNLSSLVIAILVFGLIVWFIVGGEKKSPGENIIEKLFKRR